jgi:hypothetical protein
MTGRSAQANGLEPELRTTGTIKLERRLKRQRGECGDVAVDSQGSEEGEGEGREPHKVTVSARLHWALSKPIATTGAATCMILNVIALYIPTG